MTFDATVNVVPNHLTEQWGNDFLRLYPGANVLVATKKDFEPANRKKFCSRIATGEYDAIIIGHSQFERIPLSRERQIQTINRQIEDITFAIEDAANEDGTHFTVKQMEKTKKTLLAKLEKLNDQTRKDDVVTFEQLGVDRLFVDESHYYKNLFLYTKMRNVAGISQTDAQKSSDMFMKCQYLDALSELSDRIFQCIPDGNNDNWGERFESIKDLVDAEDWKNECVYYQLLYYTLNNDKGRFSEQIEAIARNIKVDMHTDQRTLELLQSVLLPTGELTKLLSLDDILIEKTDDSFMKLKYKFDKAIQFSLVSDNTGAKDIADEVIEELEKGILYTEDELYSQDVSAQIYEMYFNFDPDLVEKEMLFGERKQ